MRQYGILRVMGLINAFPIGGRNLYNLALSGHVRSSGILKILLEPFEHTFVCALANRVFGSAGSAHAGQVPNAPFRQAVAVMLRSSELPRKEGSADRGFFARTCSSRNNGAPEDPSGGRGGGDLGTSASIIARVIQAINRKLCVHLVGKSITLYTSEDRKYGICILTSKQRNDVYWFGYSNRQDAFIKDLEERYLVLACKDKPYKTYLIPHEVVSRYLRTRGKIIRDGRTRWYFHLLMSNGSMYLMPGGDHEWVCIDDYLFEI